MQNAAPGRAGGDPERWHPMIYGKLHSLRRYLGLHPNLDTAIRWALAHPDLSTLPMGVTPIQGETVYVNRFDCATRPPEELLFEAHTQYADLHLVLGGTEAIHVSDIEDLREEKRKPESDYIGCSGDSQSVCVMRPGFFLVVFPEDAHKVKVRYQSETTVQKAVVKIKM